MVDSGSKGNMFLAKRNKVALGNHRQIYHDEMRKASNKNLNTSGGTNQTNEEQTNEEQTNEEQRKIIKTATTKMKELATAFGKTPTPIHKYSRESVSDFTKREFYHVKGHLYLYITISDITRNEPRLTKMQEVTEAIREVNINFPDKVNIIGHCGILVLVAFILATIIHALLDN